MDSLTILLLDPLSERGRNTAFLLQLARFKVSLFNNDDEAFNWIVNCQESAHRPVLLLINDCHAEMPILPLIPELRRLKDALPILLVNRDESQGSQAITRFLGNVYCCRPKNMLSQVRILTGRNQHPSRMDHDEANQGVLHCANLTK